MKIIGHRGAAGLAPENTLASIEKALELHVDEIEIDVRVTKDNIVVLSHDTNLKRTAGADLAIHDHSYAELKAAKPDLATLEEAIDTVNKRLSLQIEIKAGEPVDPIMAVLQSYLSRGWVAVDFLIGSKNQKILLEAHRRFPDIPKVVIERWSGVRASYRARQLATKRISMNKNVLWFGFIKSVARSQYQLGAYPLNDPEKAKTWERSGLYAVITDYPDRFTNEKQ